MSETYNAKNYFKQGGDELVIGGKLTIAAGAELTGMVANNQAASTAASYTALKEDFNALLIKLKDAGLMAGDTWPDTAAVLACPTASAMPTAETIANSGHATFALADGVITITLDCKVADLAVADHGETWGQHKWLGFGVRTGLAAVAGVVFTDDTGATATLGESDATEATALGLSAGDFVLYIKAEDPRYLDGDKSFVLSGLGYEKTTFTMKIVEPTT